MVFAQLMYEMITSTWYLDKPMPQFIIPIAKSSKPTRENFIDNNQEMAVFLAKKLDLQLLKYKASKRCSLSQTYVVVLFDVIKAMDEILSVCRELSQLGVVTIDVWSIARSN